MKDAQYYTYIMTNKNNTVLYSGITDNLDGRVLSHKKKTDKKSFTARYNINKLVYYEDHQYAEDAIAREKQLKAGSRKKKVELIKALNSKWKDLSDGWYRTREGIALSSRSKIGTPRNDT